VAILTIVAVVLVKTADDARDEAKVAAGTTDHSTHTTESSSAVSLPLQSFAGAVPENAEALAEAHRAYDAALPPPFPRADLVKVQMTLKDMVVEVAPGVKYNTWAFDGHGAPGPVVHVREGQTVEMTLTNSGAIPTRSTSTPRGSLRTWRSRTSPQASPSRSGSSRSAAADCMA